MMIEAMHLGFILFQQVMAAKTIRLAGSSPPPTPVAADQKRPGFFGQPVGDHCIFGRGRDWGLSLDAFELNQHDWVKTASRTGSCLCWQPKY
jgi:hypothetical protein